MSVFVTSKKIFDIFTGSGGAGSRYLNGCVGDKLYAEIEFYVKWGVENVRLTFVETENTITLSNETYGGTFLTAGFREGDTFAIVGGVSNTTEKTIESISLDGKTITTVENLATEVIESGSLWGTTPVTDIDFRTIVCDDHDDFAGFESLTDRGTEQFYTVSDLNPTGSNESNFVIATDSYGWLTEVVTGAVGETKILEQGTSEYKQMFKITHYFNQTPHFLPGFIQNFENQKQPSGVYPQFYAFKIDAKFGPENPNIVHTVLDNQERGVGRWFNQGTAGRRANYQLSSITFTNSDGDEVDAPTINDVTSVTIIITSDAMFTDDSYVQLNMINCPLDEDNFIDTETTLSQNYFHDRQYQNVGTGAQGENDGTDYQVLKNINVTKNSTSQITIAFEIDYSAYIQSALSERDENDRYCAIWVTTQSPAITTTINNDRVAILCAFVNQDYDTDDSTLMGIDSTGAYEYPNYATNPTENVVGWEGDPFYVRTRFWIDNVPDITGSNGCEVTTPTLLDVRVQMVAEKVDCDDFVLEEKSWDTSLIRKLNGTQDINIEDEKGYILPENSYFNKAEIIRLEAFDTDERSYYELRFGGVLRYEYWLSVIGAANAETANIFQSIEDVTEAWGNYDEGGWSLVVRTRWRVQGVDGNITEFVDEKEVTVAKCGETPGGGTAFDAVIQYFDENGDQVDSILEGEPTTIRATFTGDTTVFPTGGQAPYATGTNGFYGYFFADNSSSGSVFSRAFASTEEDAEDGNPFTATEDTGGDTKASANVRLILTDTSILLETIFDFEDYLAHTGRSRSEQLFIQARIGYKADNCFLTDSQGDPVLDSNLDPIDINCT